MNVLFLWSSFTSCSVQWELHKVVVKYFLCVGNFGIAMPIQDYYSGLKGPISLQTGMSWVKTRDCDQTAWVWIALIQWNGIVHVFKCSLSCKYILNDNKARLVLLLHECIAHSMEHCVWLYTKDMGCIVMYLRRLQLVDKGSTLGWCTMVIGTAYVDLLLSRNSKRRVRQFGYCKKYHWYTCWCDMYIPVYELHTHGSSLFLSKYSVAPSNICENYKNNIEHCSIHSLFHFIEHDEGLTTYSHYPSQC